MSFFNDIAKCIAFCTCVSFPLGALGQDLPPEPVSGEQASSIDSHESGSTNLNPGAEKLDLKLDQDNSSTDTAQKPENTVVPGPLQEQRQQLFTQIQAAESSGIGIKNYMMAFNYIEDMAQKGESEEAIKKRMVPLVGALANQLKTKNYLKTKPRTQQAPSMAGNLNPNQILAPGQNIQDSLRKYGGLGGSQTNDLIKKIVQQKGLAGKMPAGMDGDFIKQKLKDPKVQELLKRYSNR